MKYYLCIEDFYPHFMLNHLYEYDSRYMEFTNPVCGGRMHWLLDKPPYIFQEVKKQGRMLIKVK